MKDTAVMRYLTWFCTAIALIAIIAFLAQSWPLILFALGVSAAVAFVVRLVKSI